MKNIQIIDGASNATHSIFQVSDADFEIIFPGDQDMELIEDFIDRVGVEKSGPILAAAWERPIRKQDAMGIHGTLYYDNDDRKDYIPATKREADWDTNFINAAQRMLFAQRLDN